MKYLILVLAFISNISFANEIDTLVMTGELLIRSSEDCKSSPAACKYVPEFISYYEWATERFNSLPEHERRRQMTASGSLYKDKFVRMGGAGAAGMLTGYAVTAAVPYTAVGVVGSGAGAGMALGPLGMLVGAVGGVLIYTGYYTMSH